MKDTNVLHKLPAEVAARCLSFLTPEEATRTSSSLKEKLCRKYNNLEVIEVAAWLALRDGGHFGTSNKALVLYEKDRESWESLWHFVAAISWNAVDHDSISRLSSSSTLESWGSEDARKSLELSASKTVSKCGDSPMRAYAVVTRNSKQQLNNTQYDDEIGEQLEVEEGVVERVVLPHTIQDTLEAMSSDNDDLKKIKQEDDDDQGDGISDDGDEDEDDRPELFGSNNTMELPGVKRSNRTYHPGAIWLVFGWCPENMSDEVFDFLDYTPEELLIVVEDKTSSMSRQISLRRIVEIARRLGIAECWEDGTRVLGAVLRTEDIALNITTAEKCHSVGDVLPEKRTNDPYQYRSYGRRFERAAADPMKEKKSVKPLSATKTAVKKLAGHVYKKTRPRSKMYGLAGTSVTKIERDEIDDAFSSIEPRIKSIVMREAANFYIHHLAYAAECRRALIYGRRAVEVAKSEYREHYQVYQIIDASGQDHPKYKVKKLKPEAIPDLPHSVDIVTELGVDNLLVDALCTQGRACSHAADFFGCDYTPSPVLRIAVTPKQRAKRKELKALNKVDPMALLLEAENAFNEAIQLASATYHIRRYRTLVARVGLADVAYRRAKVLVASLRNKITNCDYKLFARIERIARLSIQMNQDTLRLFDGAPDVMVIDPYFLESIHRNIADVSAFLSHLFQNPKDTNRVEKAKKAALYVIQRTHPDDRGPLDRRHPPCDESQLAKTPRLLRESNTGSHKRTAWTPTSSLAADLTLNELNTKVTSRTRPSLLIPSMSRWNLARAQTPANRRAQAF